MRYENGKNHATLSLTLIIGSSTHAANSLVLQGYEGPRANPCLWGFLQLQWEATADSEPAVGPWVGQAAIFKRAALRFESVNSIRIRRVGAQSEDAQQPDDSGAGSGGQGQNRTADTRIFNPLLYRLSYLARRARIRRDRLQPVKFYVGFRSRFAGPSATTVEARVGWRRPGSALMLVRHDFDSGPEQ